MEISLEKIDMVRNRMAVSYKEAKEALEAARGDVVEALVWLEAEKKSGQWEERLAAKGQEVLGQVRTWIHKGNQTKIKIKKGEKTLAEIPVTVGALGVVGALASTPLAVVGAIGAAAGIANKWSVEIDRGRLKEDVHE